MDGTSVKSSSQTRRAQRGARHSQLLSARGECLQTRPWRCKQLNRPENMSVTPNLPARGAEPRAGEPEGSKAKRAHIHTRRAS